MIGYLIYDSFGIKRNEWFINNLISEASSHGVTLVLKNYSSVKDAKKDSLPNFAIIRTINPKINKYYNSRGVICFNNYKTSKIANNKWLTFKFAKKLNVSVMPTKRLNKINAKKAKYPFVAKSVNGHGGNEVFLINNKEEYDNLIKNVNVKNYIMQPVCSSVGKDIRVYLLGGKILASVLRSSETSFKSNYSLGGKASLTEINETQKQIVTGVYKSLNPTFVGIDFILDNGVWVLNEIEDAVGCRMLYELTDINVTKLFINYVIERVKNN